VDFRKPTSKGGEGREKRGGEGRGSEGKGADASYGTPCSPVTPPATTF